MVFFVENVTVKITVLITLTCLNMNISRKFKTYTHRKMFHMQLSKEENEIDLLLKSYKRTVLDRYPHILEIHVENLTFDFYKITANMNL